MRAQHQVALARQAHVRLGLGLLGLGQPALLEHVGDRHVLLLEPALGDLVAVGEVTADGDGARLELGADSLEWAARYLAGMGAEFTVVSPGELRAHVGELAARLARAAG